MAALAYISAFLGLYFLFSIFFPRMIFFLPAKCQTRGVGILLTIVFIIAAVVFVSVTHGAPVTQ